MLRLKLVKYCLCSSLCTQSKGIHVGDGVAVGVGVAIEGNCLRNSAGDDVRVDESPQLGAVVPGPHIDEAVGIRDHAVPTVVAEDKVGTARAAQKLAVGIVLKGVGNGASLVGNSDGTATAVSF